MGQVVARTGAIYGRWIAANGWSEALGLGTTLALGWRIAPSLERATGVLTVLAGALAAVLMGMVLEGVVVGAAQGAVVHRALPTLSRRSWVLATVLGAGIAWCNTRWPRHWAWSLDPYSAWRSGSCSGVT